jgi:hypothetical protein
MDMQDLTQSMSPLTFFITILLVLVVTGYGEMLSAKFHNLKKKNDAIKKSRTFSKTPRGRCQYTTFDTQRWR